MKQILFLLITLTVPFILGCNESEEIDLPANKIKYVIKFSDGPYPEKVNFDSSEKPQNINQFYHFISIHSRNETFRSFYINKTFENINQMLLYFNGKEQYKEINVYFPDDNPTFSQKEFYKNLKQIKAHFNKNNIKLNDYSI